MKRAELLKTAKPILFNTDMVRAILDGRKTETRRVVKRLELELDVDGSIIGVNDRFEGRTFPIMNYAPYSPGNILYVRETWYYEYHMHDLDASTDLLPSGNYLHRYVFKADSPDYPVDVGVGKHGWHPSIHMPKEAARIFLRVTNVRVERLQDITVRDMKAEGFLGSCFMCFHGRNKDVPCAKHVDKLTECSLEMNVINGQHMSNFINVWDSTIPKKLLVIYGWDANPWVWVIEFERIEVEA